MPSLSVVIPSHNRPDLLRICLASVVRHAPAATEILVVDDGSTDHAVSVEASRHPSVRTLRLPERRGFCVAANAGVRAANGQIVELLNDDTEVSAGWADAALAVFSCPGVGAVAPLVLLCSENEQQPIVDSAGDRYFVGGVAGKRGHGQNAGPEYTLARTVFGASASAAFYRREVFLTVGGFPESFGAYFEDVDLSFRLHRGGWSVRYEPAARVRHRASSSYGPPRHDLLAQQSRNEERVFWRNLPRGVLLRALPSHLAVVAAKAWRRWREGTLVPFLRGRLGLLGEIHAILHQRRDLARFTRPESRMQWHLENRFWGA